MTRILLPVDGSEPAMHAVDFLIRSATTRGPVDVLLVNVQPEPEIRALAMHRDVIMAEERQIAEEILAEPRRRLDEAKVPYDITIAFGDAGETIAEIATQAKCDGIVMGTSGAGPVVGLLLGSVVLKVLHLADMPVTLVK